VVGKNGFRGCELGGVRGRRAGRGGDGCWSERGFCWGGIPVADGSGGAGDQEGERDGGGSEHRGKEMEQSHLRYSSSQSVHVTMGE